MDGEPFVNGAGSQGEGKPPQGVIKKYGGTSIGKFPVQIAEQNSANRNEGPIAIVCSARSTGLKVEGTTNRLLKAAREASKPGSIEYQLIIEEVLRDHLSATRVFSPAARQKIERAITLECENLNALLSHLPESTVVAEDQVMSVGEKLSAMFMAALLEDHGIRTEYVDLSNITPIQYRSLEEPSKDFFAHLAPVIGQRIQACGDRVPVITGYFGPVPGGLLHNCGRGYSDLLAALVAVGTNARELQVWKEVSGIYTADPRKVPTAKHLSSIDPAEANELTFYGSEVIHHFTIDHCIPKIPIRIKNVKEPDGPGTLIIRKDEKEDPYRSMRPRRPTAVTTKDSITIVNVHSHRKVGSPEFLAQICTILNKHKLQVDLFELNEMHVSLAVHSQTPFIAEKGERDREDMANQHRDLQESIQELGTYGTVEVRQKMAIISLIGKELKKSIGIAGRFLTALGDNNINIEMISQGASEINISCVISGRDERRAVNVVHTALFTFSD